MCFKRLLTTCCVACLLTTASKVYPADSCLLTCICPLPLLQMNALQAGLDGTPLVLIQGPPGTGKVGGLDSKGGASPGCV